jgi:hypothetical protein
MRCYVICSGEGWYPNFKDVRVKPTGPASQLCSVPLKAVSLPRRWNQQIPLKCWCTSTIIHGITMQKNVDLLSKATAIRTIDLGTMTIL